MLRHPDAARPFGWIASAGAFMAADLLTGSSLQVAALLNCGNMVSIGIAYLVLRRLPQDVIRLRQPMSVPWLFAGCAAGGAVAGLVGMAANPILFGGGMWRGWQFWFTTELVNYVTVLPMVLAFPSRPRPPVRKPAMSLRQLAPLIALIYSCLAAKLVGGPGAIAFPVPALLWCGLSYPVFRTCILTAFCGYWAMETLANQYILPAEQTSDAFNLVSFRLGLSMLFIAPIMLTSITANRNAAYDMLMHAANHDGLTGIANRNAFMHSAQTICRSGDPAGALLMLDLDFFKSINDRYGHAGGDAVLIGFAQRVRECLRGCDLFGRVGGEEFAVLIPNCSRPGAILVAERIRQALNDHPIILSDSRKIHITASIGVAMAEADMSADIGQLMAQADDALYRAKSAGRNRIEMAD
ncbi:diguanylate cyclase (GGDEF)-like protein [Sphingobium fontiphilum]|uniref:diguanylate cyclase n=2 Tax=Sphingobium fontiphilum TaxID=944425 RepID=A0A7W6DJM0_9SPHN|nr:diguanylate cyclase (GGDEF)-like protein [Sphingobium fontiphilum]